MEQQHKQVISSDTSGEPLISTIGPAHNQVGNDDDEQKTILVHFAESLMEKIFNEAVETYERRATTTRQTGGGGSTQVGVASGEWTQERNDGTLSHMVEQTTFVEAKPRDGTSKKQRRRKTNSGGMNTEGPVLYSNNTEDGGFETATSDETPNRTEASSSSFCGQKQWQRELARGFDDENLDSPILAPKFQTADHAQVASTSSSISAGIEAAGCANILEANPLECRKNNNTTGAQHSSTLNSEPTDALASCEFEELAAQLAFDALENSLSQIITPTTTTTTAQTTSISALLPMSAIGGEPSILEQESLRNPDLDRVASNNGAPGNATEDQEETGELELELEQEEGSEYNFGNCATPDVSGPQVPLDGFESGDFSLSTTTEEEEQTTIIAASGPSSSITFNVNVSGAPPPESSLGATAQEQIEQLDSFSGQEGFMEEPSSSEGAKRELADLDSSERTRGWGCNEQGIQPAKFKDTIGPPSRPSGLVAAAAAASTTTITTATTTRAAVNASYAAANASSQGQPSLQQTLRGELKCGQLKYLDELQGASSLDREEEKVTLGKAQVASDGRVEIRPTSSITSDTGNGGGGGGGSSRSASDLENVSELHIVERVEAIGVDKIGIETFENETKQLDGASSHRAEQADGQLCSRHTEGQQPLGALESVKAKEFTHQVGVTNSEVYNHQKLSSTETRDTIKTTKFAPGDTIEQKSREHLVPVEVVAYGECAQVASSYSAEQRQASASPAVISSKQPPTRPLELNSGYDGSSEQNNNNNTLTRGPAPDVSASSSSSSTSSLSKQRPKSELIVRRRSSQAGQPEYFAATDSELYLDFSAQRSQKSSSSSSSQGHCSHKSSVALDQQDLSSNSSSQGGDLQSSSYTTAPLGQLPTSSSSNADFTTVSTSLSLYETAKSSLTATPNNEESIPSTSSSTSIYENSTTSEMVSFSIEDRVRSLSQAASSDGADTPTITPNTEELEDMEAIVESQDDNNINNESKSSEQMRIPAQPSQSSSQQQMAGRQDSEIVMDDSIDEEQLRRILTCKRLSEGCNRFGSNFVARKNSLHMIEELPPLTEGETMKHMSCHLSQTIDQSTASSSSSGSLRVGNRPQNLLRDLAIKRGSQDENTSCSSSTSLERSPTRRRSSTVSQCSSVLSESARNQLNFDLSPDLPPDSSLLEANAISPTDLERPASPEPSSFSGETFDFRPISRMSHEELILPSPDSTLGDSNDNEVMEEQLERLTQSCCHHQDMEVSINESESIQYVGKRQSQQEEVISEHLEQIISDVSSVAVSTKTSSKRPASDESASNCCLSSFGQKSARSGDQDSERRSSLTQVAGASDASRALSDSPESPIRDRVVRPESVATNQPTSHRSNTRKSSLGRNRHTPSPSANSTCSSSSSSHSSGATSRGNRSINTTIQKNNDEKRLIHLIEMERKDFCLRQKRQATTSPIPDTWKRIADGSTIKKLAPSGHRHSNQESGSLCYCHNF